MSQCSESMNENEMMKESTLPFARSFYELLVYRKARHLNREVFRITKRFPREEAFALSDQWRRAARSIGAQISEAWAKRRYPRNFISKLTDADGEKNETLHWTIVAFDDGYITRDEAHAIGCAAEEIGKMLGGMMANAESFAGDDYTLKDQTALYSALLYLPCPVKHPFVPKNNW